MAKIKIPPKPKIKPAAKSSRSKITASAKKARKLGRVKAVASTRSIKAGGLAQKQATARKKVRRRVRLAVAPVAANQYRPRAIGRFGIPVILALVVAAQFIYSEATSGSVLGVKRDVSAVGLLEATNRVRQTNDQPGLAINSQLTKAAYLKAGDMLENQYWAHESPSGTTPWHWFRSVDYQYINAGENLAKNFNTSESVISAWLTSPSHRANVLNDKYTEVGFAVVDGVLEGEDTTLIVALYAQPAVTTTTKVSALVQGPSQPQNLTLGASEAGSSMSLMTRIGLELQSMSPVTISSLLLLFLAANIALIAHIYRRKLPTALKRSWYRHHGIYKASGFLVVAVIIVIAYGNIGQI